MVYVVRHPKSVCPVCTERAGGAAVSAEKNVRVVANLEPQASLHVERCVKCRTEITRRLEGVGVASADGERSFRGSGW